VWYLLAHVLYKIHEVDGRGYISVDELSELFLHVLWGRYRVTLYENEEQIKRDLNLLYSFGFVKIRGRSVELVKDRLEKFEKSVVEKDPILTKSTTFWLAYLRKKLDEAIEKYYRENRNKDL